MTNLIGQFTRISQKEAYSRGYKPNPNGAPGEWLAPSSNPDKPMLVDNVMTKTESLLYDALKRFYQYAIDNKWDDKEFFTHDYATGKTHGWISEAQAALAKAEGTEMAKSKNFPRSIAKQNPQTHDDLNRPIIEGGAAGVTIISME